MRCEHCGLLTVSSQKKKGEIKVFQDDLSIPYSTQPVSLQIQRTKRRSYQVCEPDFLRITF